jgi:tetratricopeptide (TPR) repeat protein
MPFQQDVFGLDDKPIYQEQLKKIFDPVFAECDAIMQRYALFNLFFMSLCAFEVILVAFFFAFLAQSLILALSLSAVFFTFFAFFTLRVYFQTKKPEQLKALKDQYVAACKSLLNYQEGTSEHYIALANACCKLANRLHGREYNYYYPPGWLSFMTPMFERLSCWLHWVDLHLMKELLLQESVNEHIKRVKCQPTSLEAHAALANAYVMLSGLYLDPRTMEGYDDEHWIPEDKYNEEFDEKFRSIAERAIEEFKILGEYAPDDPWVHSQLAYSYHDLRMPLEEIKEYETIQKLIPDDKDNLYKLGMLYFEQGLNAKGLRVYEELKKAHYKRAESLIKHYGSYKP